MSEPSLYTEIYTQHPKLPEVLKFLSANEKSKIQFSKLSPQLSVLPASAIIQETQQPFLFCFFDKERSAYFYNDLQKLLPNKNIDFLPTSFRRSSTIKTGKPITDSGNLVIRTEILNKIASRTSNIIVTYIDAICEKVPQLNDFVKNSFELQVGLKLDQNTLQEFLNEYEFQSQDFVYQPGQYSIRGSIIDIFSFSNDYPFRIDFFDDEIESIRTFDIVSQLSKAKFDKVTIVPDIKNITNNQNHIPIFQYLADDTVFWLDDLNSMMQKIDNQNNETINTVDTPELIKGIENYKVIEISSQPFFKPKAEIVFNIKEQIPFNKNFELLAKDIIQKQTEGYRQFIMSEHEDQQNRIAKILYSDEIKNSLNSKDYLIPTNSQSDIYKYENITGNLSFGFYDADLLVSAYSDHRIFGRYYKFNLRTASFTKSRQAISIKELNDLKPGDFVVHSDYGIGKFGGLQTITQNDKKQEVVRIHYKDNDLLLVNIHNLHKISKYAGKDSTAPKVNKLGSKTWQNLKKRTKKKVKDIAEQIIKLYAQRKAQKGFAFSADTFLQHALESSFIYEDTPDQAKATQEVKKDMESPTPMDRLIIGDVGFGKTEIAIRAAFKAAYDAKQTAVLVPTTVLTYQHYKTFKARFKEFGVNVDFISRFKTKKEVTQTLKLLKEGKIDVIIGTHRLISKDIVFKDLGLLIIDEEQKFGVAVKDKLKEIKLNVDTLTMTATPIPRTLQFSLNGARDMSVITTPPPNRYPIETELHTFNKKIIKEAIKFEISRAGQVFFIHNRIENIAQIRDMLHRLLPNISTGIIHGRMKPAEVEDVMTGFINEEFGILIATSIIESGLDIPNANTIIINNAQNFGLSDLHQLRGRVGRADKKAFCYLLSPPKHTLNNDAQRRLEALEHFSELGSGYNIAMRDLDIRGAGNLLGGEQSGFISDVGFETYHAILEETLTELREQEYRKQITNGKTASSITHQPEEIKFVADCNIDTDLEILFPISYIENITERLKLYRQLNNIQNNDELKDFENSLIDRFGKLPKQTQELLKAVQLRWLGIRLGMEKIFIKNNNLLAYFVKDKESSFYNSKTFTDILSYIQHKPKTSRLTEKNEKLTLKILNINSIYQAFNELNQIQKN